MAVGEVSMRHWWRVLGRELAAGALLGTLLGMIAICRVWFWPSSTVVYGEHYKLIGLTVAVSLIGVVTLGTFAGSMLPFLLRRLGLDPATASAPLVATVVDVTGVIIYFTVALLILRGSLL